MKKFLCVGLIFVCLAYLAILSYLNASEKLTNVDILTNIDSLKKINSNSYNPRLFVAYINSYYDKSLKNTTNTDIDNVINAICKEKDGEFVMDTVESIMSNNDIPRKIVNKIDHCYYGEISREAVIKSKGFYISQHNEKFDNIPYSGGNMSEYGCGPIALTMALNILKGSHTYDAIDIAKWAKENGYTDSIHGTMWDMIDVYVKWNNIPVNRKDFKNVEEMKKTFKDGKIIITTMKKGAFTDEGHFIVLVGIDQFNQVEVLDSASIYRTSVNWSFETIVNESKGVYWVIG